MALSMTIKSKRYETNPFTQNLSIPIGTKSIQISPLGQDNNILVNQNTGEINGTHVIARKRVDSDKFVKTFSDYMAFTFDLTRAGNKALRIVMWSMKEYSIGKDQVILDKHTLAEFLLAYKDSHPPLNLSYPTFARGLSELEKASLIAKTIRVGWYFINPNCYFNGDRVAFTTVIERASEEQEDLPIFND